MSKKYAIKNLVVGAMTLTSSLVGAQVFAPVEGIEEIVSKMTVEEKASLCSGAGMWTTKAVERVGVPSITMTDGPHGVRKQASGGQFAQNIAATCYPPAVTLASTWNSELAYEVGEALGEEAQAMDVQILLGPGTNIKRSPYGGRNFEYFSEDPILSGVFSTEYIRGVQSQGVGVSLKHFAVNDQETERMTISSEISQRAMHEIYLRPFEMAVKNAKPTTLMCAYNKINGVYAADNKWLLDDLLRDEWGFEGIVVTDWGAINDRVLDIQARLHLQMPYDGGGNDKKIVEAVKNGSLDEAELDEVVASILQVTYQVYNTRGRYTSYDKDEHHQLARKVAGEGIVLLKNEKNILPLDKKDNVAVVGNFAKIARYQGAGSSQVTPNKVDNLIDFMDDAKFAKGYDMMGKTTPELLAEVAKVSKSADKVVVVVGLTFLEESEGFDRKSYGIAKGHQEVLEMAIKHNDNVVVVLQNGSPVAMPWLNDVDAVVEAYLGGEAGGGALADVLYGKVNPSGKLAETFPVRIEDNPTYIGWAGEEGKVYYNEGVYVGYRYYAEKKVAPLFPFGFGLSYTTFEMSDIKLSKTTASENEAITVSVKVKNTGDVDGQEVVQLYLSDLEASVGRPEKELKHFKKVYLKAGETKTVTFNLGRRDYSYYSEEYNQWMAETGTFLVRVGNSSDNLPLEKELNINVKYAPKKVFTKYSMLKELKGNSIGDKMVADMLANLMGGANEEVDMSQKSEQEQVEALKWKMLMEAMMEDMPLKNLVQFSGGKMTEAQLDQMIFMINQ